jgi:glycosyltransferase involved in cell wall biosynthesis
MDIFCLSSRTEGFPNVVGEAMTMGVPCVVTDVGDAAVLVGDAGIVVPKENPTELARGIRKLITTPCCARRQLGQKARERIYQEFSIQRTRDSFETLYQRTITNQKR